MFGLIILLLLLVLCLLVPPLAIIIVPFVLLSIITGLFFRSLSKSITGPIGNDVRWSGERIATAIEGPTYTTDDEDLEDNSISPALQAAQLEYEEEENKKKVKNNAVKPKTVKRRKKKDNSRLIQDIEDFLKESG